MSDETDEDYSLGAGEVLAETELALRVMTENEGTIWIPRSVLHPYSDLNETAEKGDEADDVCVHMWFALERGFI